MRDVVHSQKAKIEDILQGDVKVLEVSPTRQHIKVAVGEFEINVRRILRGVDTGDLNIIVHKKEPGSDKLEWSADRTADKPFSLEVWGKNGVRTSFFNGTIGMEENKLSILAIGLYSQYPAREQVIKTFQKKVDVDDSGWLNIKDAEKARGLVGEVETLTHKKVFVGTLDEIINRKTQIEEAAKVIKFVEDKRLAPVEEFFSKLGHPAVELRGKNLPHKLGEYTGFDVSETS